MNSFTTKILIALMALLILATVTAAQTTDEQIAAAEKEQEKLIRLNKILKKNNEIRAANELLQKGQDAKAITVGEDDKAKKVESAPPNDEQQKGNTASKEAEKSEVKKDAPPSDNKVEDEIKIELPNKKLGEKSSSDTDKKGEVKTGGTVSGAADNAGADIATANCPSIIKNKKTTASYDLSVCVLAFRLVQSPNYKIDETDESSNENFAVALNDRFTGSQAVGKLLADIEAEKSDKQVGSDSKNTGTTNLATGARIPVLFNMAIENGLATSSTQGTTVNFRFNPVGVIQRLNSNTSVFESTPEEEVPWMRALRRTAFGLSYDTARGVKIPGFTGSREQLSGLSFSYALVNPRDPNGEVVRQLTNDFNSTFLTAYQDKTGELSPKIYGDSEVKKFLKTMHETIANADKKDKGPGKIADDAKENVKKAYGLNEGDEGYKEKMRVEKAKIIYDTIRELFVNAPEAMSKNLTLTTALTEFNRSLLAYEKASKEFRRRLLREKLMTFDYNYIRTFAANDVSNLKFIYEKGWATGMDFIFNSSFSMFHAPLIKVPTTAALAAATTKQRRFRDFSFTSELDVPLRGLSRTLGDSTLSLGLKWQRLLTDSIVLFDGTEIANLKGNLFLGQAKVRVPISAEFSLPLSFTYSNRPELVREKQSRGNIGFTFDLSQLLERFNPFSSLINASREQK